MARRSRRWRERNGARRARPSAPFFSLRGPAAVGRTRMSYSSQRERCLYFLGGRENRVCVGQRSHGVCMIGICRHTGGRAFSQAGSAADVAATG